MTSSALLEGSRWNRRSRFVRIPTSRFPATIGTPEIWLRAMTSRTWAIVASGVIVIGS